MLRLGIRKPWGSFGVCCALLLWLLVRHLDHMAHPKWEDNRPPQPYGVMGTLWASGGAVRNGLNPYAEYPNTFKPRAFTKDGPVVLDLNLNPPALLPLLSIVSRWPLPIIARAWEYLSTLLLLLSTGVLVWRYHPERYQIWWLLTGGAAIGTLTLQQDYTLLFAIAVAMWLLLEADEELAAGICLGVLCAIKPNFGIWPIALAFSGKKKVAISAFVAFAILSILPVVLYGPSVYPQWFKAAGIDSHIIFPSDVSFIGNATRFGVRPLGYALAVLMILAVLMLAKFGKSTLREVSGMAICAALLCSPLAWMHYLLILAPIFVSRFWTRGEQIAAWLLWINPVFLEPSNPNANMFNLAIRGLFYFLPLLYLWFSFAREPIGEMNALRTLFGIRNIESRTVRWLLIAFSITAINVGAGLAMPFYIAFCTCLCIDLAILFLYLGILEPDSQD